MVVMTRHCMAESELFASLFWVFRTAELSARAILLYALLLLHVLSSLEVIHKQIEVVATVY